MTKNLTPLEHEEQKQVVKWLIAENEHAELLKLPEIKFSAIANGHWQSSEMQKRKLKAEGMNSGVPDLLIILPPERCKLQKWLMIWIEMKRRQGGSVSDAQEQWIEAINNVSGEKGDVGAFVCKGSDEAINLLKDFVIKL